MASDNLAEKISPRRESLSFADYRKPANSLRHYSFDQVSSVCVQPNGLYEREIERHKTFFESDFEHQVEPTKFSAITTVRLPPADALDSIPSVYQKGQRRNYVEINTGHRSEIRSSSIKTVEPELQGQRDEMLSITNYFQSTNRDTKLAAKETVVKSQPKGTNSRNENEKVQNDEASTKSKETGQTMYGLKNSNKQKFCNCC